MSNLQQLQRMLTEGVPFNRLLGIELTDVQPEQVELRLPVKPEHLNHVGTVHAAAQFALGEAASGAMMVVAFGNVQNEGLVPLVTQANTRYKSPAQGDIKAVARLSQQAVQQCRATLEEAGKSRFTVTVQILDAGDKVTAELDIEWILLKKR